MWGCPQVHNLPSILLLFALASALFGQTTPPAGRALFEAQCGNRYTKLDQINKGNVVRLAPRWFFPMPGVARNMETTPVVVGGIMYVTAANECWALSAGSGKVLWHFQQPRTQGLVGNGSQGFNRGVGWAGDRIFMVTDHAHLLALNRFTGEVLWDMEMANWRENYNATSAPLTVGNL